MDRTSTGGGLQRARQMRYASNNVFEYALDLGLDRDSVEHLERQYRSSRTTVKDCVEKVQLGFEVRIIILHCRLLITFLTIFTFTMFSKSN